MLNSRRISSDVATMTNLGTEQLILRLTPTERALIRRAGHEVVQAARTWSEDDRSTAQSACRSRSSEEAETAQFECASRHKAHQCATCHEFLTSHLLNIADTPWSTAARRFRREVRVGYDSLWLPIRSRSHLPRRRSLRSRRPVELCRCRRRHRWCAIRWRHFLPERGKTGPWRDAVDVLPAA